MTHDLLRDRTEGIETLTLNRPQKRNALDLALVGALHAAFEDLERDPDLRAVVITGAGGNFMAGADIAQLRERGVEDALASINGSLFSRLEALPVPVVAAVEGFALGGGCELALACDLRIGARSTRLGQPEVGLGIVPGAGALYRLPRIVGQGMARELIYTGRLVDATEAERIGLLNRVTEDGAALATATDLARQIARQGPGAVRLAKLALNAQLAGPGPALERLAQGILFESEDKRARMTAFLERKKGS